MIEIDVIEIDPVLNVRFAEVGDFEPIRKSFYQL